MFKLVDTFQGWEGAKRYATIEEAEKALDRERKAFRSNPTFKHSTFCKEVVPATLEWDWNHKANCFMWQ
jgi:hypothetical protein